MKNTSSKVRILMLALASELLAATGTIHAQTQVYSEGFETDHSADGTWVVNSVGGLNPVNLNFDYSTVGIPPAPHSVGGTTHGLKLQANLNPLVQQFPSGSSASPVGFDIPAYFDMRWDWWINYNGPLNGGGSGSTQIGGGGFGTAATIAQVAGATIDSIFVCASGESAGTAADYRVYSPAAQASWQDGSGVYTAFNFAAPFGARNNINPYYQATFPSVSAPAAQKALYPQQTGSTQGGSAGMAWHEVSLKRIGSVVTYTIDGLLIATTDLATNGSLGGTKLVFGHFDINAIASLDPNAPALAFSLVDNVRVTDLCLGETVPPTITPPGDIVVLATSPAGAEVTYVVTATDNCPGPVDLLCQPASGSTFPIGVTTVSCVAEDVAGNMATSSFTVRVKGAAEQISDLITEIQNSGLSPGTASSLLGKLQDASLLVSKGNITGACGKLKDFIDAVSAQAGGRKLTEAQAQQFIMEATRIRAVLGC